MAESDSSILASKICNQIASIFSKPTSPHRPPSEILVAAMSSTSVNGGKVFTYGVGREGLMLKALCMRLSHLGLNSHSVLDMTVPAITGNDLLVVSAGPGGFPTVDAISGVARSNGARVIVLTAQPDRVTCGGEICYLPAQTMADDGGEEGGETRSLMLMGSAYEGALYVLFEMVVYELGRVLGQSPQCIRARHTNLE